MLLDLAARLNLRAPCEGIEAVFVGLDADAALSDSSICKASISVTVGVIVKGSLDEKLPSYEVLKMLKE